MNNCHSKYAVGYFVFLLGILSGCSQSNEISTPKLFTKLTPNQTNITFSNDLTESDSLNYFNYPYIYMGGGVSIADFNNDQLPDIYFTGNMVANSLYLNKGNLQFEDITKASNSAGDSRWMLGTTVCDINSDGWLDIYVSVSGKSKTCKNILLVNQGPNENGIPTFREEAEKYGIDDPGHSVQSTFFDYDNDGDLDLYVANYPITDFESPIFYYDQMMRNAKSIHSDHLYRNDGKGAFTDVTREAGVLNFGLSLGIAASDFNQDGYTDLYISNDFASKDHFYFNNGDGTFTDKLKKATKQTSYYGMGIDVADYNNDGLFDLIQVDMAPEDNRRSKENMSGMDPEAFEELVSKGLHHQYMYNSLQLNRGIKKDGTPLFSNVAQLAGISSTDWSWSPIMADLDNDGWKDIYISNGTRRDINNNDYFNSIKSDDQYFSNNDDIGKTLDMVFNIPSEPIANYVFRNNGDLTFTKYADTWGLDDKGFSNGSTYADLDNDGDLELIVNNIDEAAYIYQNNSQEINKNNFLTISLNGPKDNHIGLGTKATIWSSGRQQTLELTLSRGFQSSVAPNLHFGLGNASQVDSLEITWPNGYKYFQSKIAVNQQLVLNIDDALIEDKNNKSPQSKTLFEEISDTAVQPYFHQENSFNDYKKQVLLPHKMSNFGPALAVGDVNGDQLDDFYLGGAAGYEGLLFIQSTTGKFDTVHFQSGDDRLYEDINALFFDADGDGDNDLYIVSGGNEFEPQSKYYQDRIYINNSGTLELSNDAVPAIIGSGSCVVPNDMDQDGDIDLFIGGRLSPWNYPYAGKSYLLENRSEPGQIKFVDITEEHAPKLSSVGMVTDATWTDINNDNTDDLVIVGEWMPITVFINNDEVLELSSDHLMVKNNTGWWFSIEKSDLDNDGMEDLVLGNLGLNYKYKANPEASFDIYAGDFDKNNTTDIVLSYYNFGEQYPVRGRQCSSQQIPAIKSKYENYEAYSQATVTDIFGSEQLSNSLHYQIESFASVVLFKNSKGYEPKSLPIEAQFSSINDMIIDDFDDDRIKDIMIAGNLYSSEIETPRNDGSLGLMLKGEGNRTFSPIPFGKSGLVIPHDSKQLKQIEVNNLPSIITVSNQGPLQLFSK